MEKKDIAIVGGGISGLYCAYKLKKKFPQKNIALYEMLPMLGGRIQTGSFANGRFLPGFGALRIEPDFQTETDAFVKELNIAIQPIEQGEAKSKIMPQLDRLTDEERALIVGNPEKGADLLLLELALQKILGTEYAFPGRTKALFNGKPLYQQGIWNVFSAVLSYEAVEFVREKGAYYNMKNDNQNAADWIILLLNQRAMKKPSYIPKGGMIELINHIADKASVPIHLNHQLTALQEYDKRSLLLHFDTKQIVADEVILALPQYPLQKLARYFPDTITKLLESVIPMPILWVAATMKNPPWGEGAEPTSGENAPIRAAHLEYKEPYGMAMLYCDGPWRDYWRYYIEGDEQHLPEVNKNSFLKREIEKTIQQMFGLKNALEIDEWGIRDWGRPPFGAGVHSWKVGADAEAIIDKLSAFSLKENGLHQNVHISGEAYSEVQGYFEGAIRTANRVIKSIEVRS